MSEECLKKCLNDSEMSKAEDKVVEFFNRAEAVQVDEGTWYYHELSVESELKSLHEQLAKANERVKGLERKEGLFDQYALESEVMRKALLNKDRSADDVSPSDLKQALNKFAIEKKIELLSEMVSSASIYLFKHDKLDIRANHLDMLLKNFCNYHREKLRKEQE